LPFCFASPADALAKAADRPNIIFFLSDDHRWDCMGCAGHPFLKTPTIDRLAAQGVRFSNMIVTISICAASRATAMFGRLMTVNVAGTTQPFEELFGPRLKQFRFQHPLWLLQDWREVFDSAAIVQTGEVDGEKVFVLKLSAKGVPFSFLPKRTLLLTLYMMFAIKNRFSSVNIEFVLRTIDLLSLGRSGSSAV
jgi:hypothetical protein